ncbi:PDGLE domain-containing protein [Gloeobacter kilaueensis]|uniref:PDGLE domain-containing protein n=1 Tax=Gloeobacter kilaueensis (strain ATCC BAA-2537 / CCAP 1431/1 / ULC 316 / JS1) TaxID=1183438 RepID=U5QMK2_GLOK1|nr:PDGLE domain-containing protein [Gloeobacter kilaueensis]AGY60156.1 hypothetical protein GKIL_3910 [Gloeobacter kilaueensis JS1]
MRLKGAWILAGLALALLVALLSPLSSADPDGLQRVAAEHGFGGRALPSWAARLPFARLFDGYGLRGLGDPALSRIAAGIAGTLVVFALAWGAGLLLRSRRPGDRRL